MSRIQILSAQIQTDMNDIIVGVEEGGQTTEELMESLVRVNSKIKDWAKEVDSILEV